MSDAPNAIYALQPHTFDKIYGPDERTDIARLTAIEERAYAEDELKAAPERLADVEVVFSGWGGPCIDAAFLAAAPRLRAVFYGAGSIKHIQSDAFWEADIPIASAWGANAVPVAEYTLSQILFSLKRGWAHVMDGRTRQAWPQRFPVAGAYGSTVGIVSLGMIGRMVCEHLRRFDVRVIACDPFVEAAAAADLGVELVDLPTVFRDADVVSLHTPWLPETVGLVTGELIASMKEGASFLNTARGAVVREDELCAVLAERSDLWAVLDVTWPEPPAEGSPLYTLPNVILTPHIAGSLDRECRRMGRTMVEECERFLRGEPLRWRVTREMFVRMA